VATNHNPEKGTRTLNCEAWEAMLTDALDGTLDARDAAAFEAHSKSCAAGCAQLLEEAKRGTEWLRFLRQTPEAPQGLLEKILAGTTGVVPDAPLPLAANGGAALPRQPWLGVPVQLLQRHMAESRILMTLAMAFFSLALTLNLTGVRLNQLKLSDLKPSTLATAVSHQYYSTYKNVAHYYMNLRIYYELESRVNEMRGRDNSAPASQPANEPQPQEQQKQPQAQPSHGGKPGGSARKDGDAEAPQAAPRVRHYEAPVPVLAEFDGMRPTIEARERSRIFSSGPELSIFSISRPGDQHKPSERSLA
jgi:Putative zinc-finger